MWRATKRGAERLSEIVGEAKNDDEGGLALAGKLAQLLK